MPDNTVYVGRGSKFGNPWKVGEVRHGQMTTPELACQYYREDLCNPNSALDFELSDVEQLRGKNLSCWCPLDKPCHADILLEWAND